MTIDEAKEVAKLIGYADHACNNCVGDLVDHANRLFPGFVFAATDETVREEWPSDWDEEHMLYADRIVVTVSAK